MSLRAGGLWSLSLRELLALVAVIGLACVSLKFAGEWSWMALSGAVMLLTTALLIVAVIDRGARQAFAIGFMLTAGVYAVMYFTSAIANGAGRELDPYDGSLPTTKILRPLFENVSTVQYTVQTSGGNRAFATHAEAETFLKSYGGPAFYTGGGLGGGGGFNPGISFLETPARADFFSIAHLWWMLLFGYLGGRFGLFIFHRRAL
jgi:hypothetical protein